VFVLKEASFQLKQAIAKKTKQKCNAKQINLVDKNDNRRLF
jgi:hypothetical protein